MEIAALLFLIVWALDDNGSPQRSKKIRFDLAQSVGAQAAPADQIPTCEQLLSELESDPRTQQASAEERRFVRAFLQTYVQRLLDEGVPGASRLDPDGNGIACDELRSASGSQSASAGSASPQPSVDGGSQLLDRYGNLFHKAGRGLLPTLSLSSSPATYQPDGVAAFRRHVTPRAALLISAQTPKARILAALCNRG